MRVPILAVWLAAGVAMAGCGSSSAPGGEAAPTSKIFDTIKADEVHWNADWKSGDAAKVASHYDAAAKVMLPGAQVVDGLPAIENAVQKDMDTPGFALTFSSDKIFIARSGDLAVARGVYTQTTTNPSNQAVESQSGTFVTVYRPGSDGAWKAQWGILTPGLEESKPAPPAP